MKTTVRSVLDTGDVELQVTRSEVHKQQTEHVWLGTAHVHNDPSLRADFRLPTTATPSRFVEFMEVQRQAGMVHAHRLLGVPSGDVFVLNAISLFLSGTALAEAGASGVIEVRAERPGLASRRVRAASQQFTIHGDNGWCGGGTSEASFLPPSAYERLRGVRGPGAPAPLLSDAPCIEVAMLSTAGDPLLSDHASDHVSAMAVVSGIENTVHNRLGGARLSGLALRFHSYIEHSPSVPTLRLHQDGPTTFQGVVMQADIPRVSVDGTIDRTFQL